VGVGKEIFDGAKAGLGRRRKAVHELQFVEKHGKIGGELGHGRSVLALELSRARRSRLSQQRLAKSSTPAILSISVSLLHARESMRRSPAPETPVSPPSAF